MNRLASVLLSASALGLVHCSLVVGTDTRTVGPTDAGVTPTEASTPVDSGGGNDAKPPPVCNLGATGNCVSNAETCKQNCDDGKKDCHENCPGGQPGQVCNDACEQNGMTCKSQCNTECLRCGTDLGCTLTTTCQNATK
ncbi:hypothetical protein BH09MYX1_BH09MYX1_28870 [soil metagenome]